MLLRLGVQFYFIVQLILFSRHKNSLEIPWNPHPHALFLIYRLRYNLPVPQHLVFFLDGAVTPCAMVRPWFLREPPTLLGGRAGGAVRAAMGGDSTRERGTRWRGSSGAAEWQRWKEARE